MGQTKTEVLSHEMQSQRRMQLVYTRKTQERRIFMEDLSDYRKRNDKAVLKEIKKSMGTRWYQVLSVPQTVALDTLEFCMYQDLLEGRPNRTQRIMTQLGIFPRPNADDLMYCIYCGRDDPKVMFSELFLIRYDHAYDIKRTKYDLNARLILTSIYYLGLPQLLKLLREQFQPDQPELPSKPKMKRKPGPPLPSPYLQKMIAICYEPKQWVRKPPPPLPNLDALNEPVDETPPVPKPPPPPPPPPPPKKRLPRAYCDKLAGLTPRPPEPYYCPTTGISRNTFASKRSLAVSVARKNEFMKEEKKVYGIGNTRLASRGKRRKPKPPSTGLWNSQYTICGVFKVRGKSVFILGSVAILPVAGDIIHGGHALVLGDNVNIYRGVRGQPPSTKSGSCDCVKTWAEQAFNYLKQSKCYCGHHYDFYNEGVFPPEELPFFEKPTRHGPFQIKYDNIYDIDPKSIQVGKEFKRLWDTDSTLLVEDPNKKKPPPKKKKRTSKTCLGMNPKIRDYLKCALVRLQRINMAARLPDIYMAPELVAWMYRRLHGPYTRQQKKRMLLKSNVYWVRFSRFASEQIPHVPLPIIPKFKGTTTWNYKQALTDSFRKFTFQHRLKLFRAHAEYCNMMWPSMFQAQLPDKKFREIYFSYLFGTVDDLTLLHPYNTIEAEMNYAKYISKPYRCIPAGIEKI